MSRVSELSVSYECCPFENDTKRLFDVVFRQIYGCKSCSDVLDDFVVACLKGTEWDLHEVNFYGQFEYLMVTMAVDAIDDRVKRLEAILAQAEQTFIATYQLKEAYTLYRAMNDYTKCHPDATQLRIERVFHYLIKRKLRHLPVYRALERT